MHPQGEDAPGSHRVCWQKRTDVREDLNGSPETSSLCSLA